MADGPPRQGWRVPQRVPALAALATIGLVAALLSLAGYFYQRHLAPLRRHAITTFPAPGVESYVHDGQGDPPRPRPEPVPDRVIAAAKRAVVAEGWRAMKRLLPLLLLAAAPASAQLDQRALDRAVARPAAGVELPAALAFIDQRGAMTTLGAVAAGRPLVLLFADYTCRHVCGPGMTLTAAALHDSGLVAGRDYAVAVVGLDPRDGIPAARAFARRIAAPDVAAATRLLVGTPATVRQATTALGYGYAYDAGSDQFAHDASVYVFTRDGRLAALLPELGLRAPALRAALAGGAAPEGFADRVARLCYGLGAAHGRYGRPVLLALQAMALLTVAGGAVFLWRRRRA